MRFKLDENLGERGASVIRAAGHDVMTVAEQGLSTSSDRQVIDVCTSEARCLVTLDLDFSNTLVFPPKRFAGIVVLRVPHRAGPAEIDAAIEMVLVTLGGGDLRGKLWVADGARVREYVDRFAPAD